MQLIYPFRHLLLIFFNYRKYIFHIKYISRKVLDRVTENPRTSVSIHWTKLLTTGLTFRRWHQTCISVLHQQNMNRCFGYETKLTAEWVETAKQCEVCRLFGCFSGDEWKPEPHLMGCEEQKVDLSANYWSHRIKSLRDVTCDEKEVGLKQLLLKIKRFKNSSVRVTLLQVRMLSQSILFKAPFLSCKYYYPASSSLPPKFT